VKYSNSFARSKNKVSSQKLEAQSEQAKLNNEAALVNSLATQARAANQNKAIRI